MFALFELDFVLVLILEAICAAVFFSKVFLSKRDRDRWMFTNLMMATTALRGTGGWVERVG